MLAKVTSLRSGSVEPFTRSRAIRIAGFDLDNR